MSSKVLTLISLVAFVGASVLSFAPAASASHNCAIEDVTWSGIGERPINQGLILADQACDGYHGHPCDGKYLNYGWFGICI